VGRGTDLRLQQGAADRTLAGQGADVVSLLSSCSLRVFHQIKAGAAAA
jgi:hypothetical protein